MKRFSFLVKKASSLKNWFFSLALIYKIIILLFVGALGFYFIPRILSQEETPQYQTATAEKGTLVSSVTASGSVASGGSASITTSASGIVSEVFVNNGDLVNQGDKIATLTLDQASQQKQAAALSSYLSAKNTLTSANSSLYSIRSAKYTKWKTYMELADSASYDTNEERNLPEFQVAQNDWYATEAEEKNQQAVIAQAQAAMSGAWLAYSQTSSTITAPISGRVENLTLNPGIAIVGSSSTTTNGSSTTSSQSFGSLVLDGGTPQTTVNVSEIDVTKVKTGQKATLTLDAFPDKTFTGKVSSINTNGSVSSGVTTYPVTITFETNVSNMYPNMAVSATIITDIKDNVVLVPTSAIQTTSGESSVRIMKNGQIMQVTVGLGDSNDTQTEIVSGLNEGDTVVTGQTSATTFTQTTSPFGGTGFGGRGFGGGGQNIIRR